MLLQLLDGPSTDCLQTLCLQGPMVPPQCRTPAWAPTLGMGMGMAPQWACHQALPPLQRPTMTPGSHRAHLLGPVCGRHPAMTVWLEGESEGDITHVAMRESYSCALGAA